MKNEQEFKWIVLLLNCDYVDRVGFFKKGIGGCKKDFERIAGASDNNKQFRVWIKKLIDEDIIEKIGIAQKGIRSVDTYIIRYDKLVDKLLTNALYDPTRQIFRKRVVLMDIPK